MALRSPASLALLLALLAATCAVSLGQRGTRTDERIIAPNGSFALPAPVRGEASDDDGLVAHARVRFKGDPASAFTDAAGWFTLDRPAKGPDRITAWKDGYLIAGARADRGPLSLRLTRLPAEDNDGYAWVDPTPDSGAKQNCGNCHAAIYNEWSASGHARSATGRHFLNLYEGSDWQGRANVGWSLLREHPDGSGVCNACHAPTMPLDSADYFDIRTARGVAARGVHCDYCHKISGDGGGAVGLTHGRFNLRLLRPKEGQLFFGPLDDVDRGEDAYSAFYQDSGYCASCHEGTVFGVHVYGTYSEWLESPAKRRGKQCQTCHMAPTGRMTNIAPGRGGIERDPKSLANHRFIAGSQLDMLRQALQLGVSRTTDKTGVHLDIELRADGAGHRVPTGFIDRHLLLVIEGFDKDGKPLAATSGPRLPAVAGEGWTGLPGRLYGKVLRDDEGRSPAPFWRAGAIVTDTRLVPGQADRSTFMFPTGLERVRVRLLYRRFWHEVATVKKWPDNDLTVFDRVEGPAAGP